MWHMRYPKSFPVFCEELVEQPDDFECCGLNPSSRRFGTAGVLLVRPQAYSVALADFCFRHVSFFLLSFFFLATLLLGQLF